MAKLFKLHGGKNACWFFRISDNGERKRVSTCTTDKRLAEEIKAKHLADRSRVRSGTASHSEIQLAKFAKATIDEQKQLWLAMLRSKGSTTQHVLDCSRAVEKLSVHWDWKMIRDLTEDGLTSWLDEQKQSGKSNRTIQKYGRACKQFSKWLATADKIAHDPFKRVQLPNPEAQRVRRRRMLLPAEWPWILEALRDPLADESYGMKPSDRELLYDLAIQTGLRSNELRSLLCGDLVVGKDACYIRKQAQQTKNRLAAKQYVRRPLAEQIRSRKRLPRAAMFVMPRVEDCVRMLRVDLNEARNLWLKVKCNDPSSDFLQVTNDLGDHLDFHSLRHTCGAWLAIAGVNPKVIQTVMRHSTITLTLDTYGHLLPGLEQDAVEQQLKVFDVAKCGPLFGRTMA